MVLLKNDQKNGAAALPLDPKKKTAVIGPLGDNQHDMLGPWWGKGLDEDAVSVYDGIKAQSPGATFSQGCEIDNLEPPANTPENECSPTDGFADAVAKAKAADQVVLALGESREMSAEAASRSEIDLPGKQQELIDAIAKTGKPFVVVLFNGRPLTLSRVAETSPAILEAWFPGIEAGNAVADVALRQDQPRRQAAGVVPAAARPGADLLQPRADGSTLRRDPEVQLALPRPAHVRPAVPFGFGLSYTTFSISSLDPGQGQGRPRAGRVKASVTVKNTGSRTGDEVVQLYLHDPVATCPSRYAGCGASSG